jgi:UDP-N-acetylglucosamine:LPS N-acetylglucosamine transferase
MRKITLIYIDSGGGHRAAATALRDVIGRQGRPWEVEMVCIQNLFAPIDFVRQFTGIPFQDIYNIVLRNGWTLGSAQMIRAMHLLMRMSHGSQVQTLRRYWAQSQSDLVVSLIPHFNRAISEALDAERPGVPFVTILTDIADHPPHFWIERESQYVVCGSGRAANQARAIGISPDRIFQTSGMILNPAFYAAPKVDRDVERLRLGLHPDTPTGLVLFGGEGSDDMVTIARALNKAANQPVQLILLCGKNAKVAAQLRAIDRQIPMFIEGFTREVPFYMELADFFIGKPGPGSISEALAKRLPVIVQRNPWTLAHERYNADWVEEQGTGLVVRDFASDIGAAVEILLTPENYSRFRGRAASTRNMAVFEIPDILDRIMRSVRRDREPDCVAQFLPESVRLA